MYRDLSAAGVDTELHIFAGEPHGFDAQPALGRQCASMMALFLDRYVLNRAAQAAGAAT